MKRIIYLCILLLGACTAGKNGAVSKDYNKEITKHRAEYKKKFLETGNSPLKTKEAVNKLAFFDADESYKIKTTFTSATGQKPFDMATSSGKNKKYITYGTCTFSLNGTEQTLAVYRSLDLMKMPQYRDYLFIPFKDKTNNIESYGGGRYLDIRLHQIKGDELTLDFNKAYNPYCAFSDGYACPIPPKENHLAVEIKAGEKKYK